MKDLEELIAQKRTLFVGVGNVLKGDDAAGVYLTSLIKEDGNIQTLIVETGIENYIGKINRIAPELTIIVDAAHIDCQPGAVRLCDPEGTVNATTHTHNIALSNLTRLFDMPCMVLCIQPATLQLGADLSPAVRRACIALAATINKTA